MHKAFTLIELLIVVAIIAILAAIAVPNLLEAQTRAKVSRTKNDLKTVGVALQLYQVDFQEPPPPTGYTDNMLNFVVWLKRVDPGRTGGIGRRLTSPVAFITAPPPDVFVPINAWKASDPTMQWMSFGYAYYGKRGLFGGPEFQEPHLGSQMAAIYGAHKRFRWILQSGGPDQWYNWGSNHNDPQGWQAVKGGLGGIYDPTNGTISAGDMYFVETIGLIGGGGR